jgi:DNA-binding NarL/FixJ family response regulator
MSKHRPSNKASSRRVHPPDPTSIDYWRKRVFRNCYTRNGTRYQVSHWSVKIQFRGQRKTFSLRSNDRDFAAAEAQAIYERITRLGWAEASAGSIGGSVATAGIAFDQAEVAEAWQPRLLQRKYSNAFSANDGGGLSVRIEHAGQAWCFPLNTSDRAEAIRKARQIHGAVLRQGWEAACGQFVREITIAFHWSANPVAWTYATLHTRPHFEGLSPTSSAMQNRPRGLGIVIVDSDAAIRNALAECAGAQEHCYLAATFCDGASALRGAVRSGRKLWLINHSLPDMPANALLNRVLGPSPTSAGIVYSVYEDSDQLFKATPGGAAGYLLKRTSSMALFEPIGTPVETVSPDLIAARVRQYFQSLVRALPSSEELDVMAKLTQREHEIMNLLSKGYLDKEIADTLKISTWTVHGHLKKIFEKLGVHTRTEAAVRYLHK